MYWYIIFVYIVLFGGREYIDYIHRNRILMDIGDPIGFRYIFVYQLE